MKEENKIIWKVCPIAEFFEVSTIGNVRLTNRERFIKPCNNGNGYMYVTKVLGSKKKHYYVHRLVAATFLENPNNLLEVNHKDGNKENNAVSNLEWCSRRDNAIHAIRTGLKKPSEKQKAVARETAKRSLPAMREGWEKWYATEEGRRKCVEHAKTNLEAIKQKKCASI